MLTREEITAASIQFGETTNGTATETMAHNIGATWANEQNAAEVAALKAENKILKVRLENAEFQIEEFMKEAKKKIAALKSQLQAVERDSE